MVARPWSWIAPALLAALPAAQLGCSQVVCGDGTVERDGTCQPADEQPGSATCGLGTELSPGGTCVPSDPTVCDPLTTEEQVDPDTGVTTCVGTTSDPCTPELQCPTPAANKLTLCGRLFDTETDEPIRAVGATGVACDPAAPTADGPCSLKLQFFDALLFQQSPTTTPPLAAASVTVDDCGRYVARDVTATSFGFVGAATDDASGVADTRLLTGVATADNLAVPARNFRVYATRKTTDLLWTPPAMLGGTDTFASLGVLVMIFRHAGVPVAGVTIQQNGSAVPASDYYFTDAGKARTLLDRTRDVTGANGTGLFINANAPVPFTGTGAEPAGCRWPTALAATIPGVVFVQLKDAESTGGGPCP
jgi:hypothetical protein